jgi:hypothetical protein
VAEDDVYNRYTIMRRTQRRSVLAAFALTGTFVVVESISNIGGAIRRKHADGLWERLVGRLLGLGRILIPSGVTGKG